MVCESWKAKLDTYVDGELPDDEMRSFVAHVRTCPSCSADALARVQMKRAIQTSGKRFAPSAAFRSRIQQSISPRRPPIFRIAWMFAAAAAILVVGAILTSPYLVHPSGRDHIFSEIADLHVETLASSTPVDVLSTDRHTVKPWFQGRIPFAFNLPELQNTDFSLLGGRITYLEQSPGAHLIYDVRKHHISVFIFQDRPLPGGVDAYSLFSKKQPFNVKTWAQDGLRYLVIGDASSADIERLAALFRTAS